MKIGNLQYSIIILLVLILVLYLIIGYTNKRYYNFYPTLYLYPNNETDVKIVEKYNNERLNNKEIEYFVRLIDRSCAYAFIHEIDELTLEELNAIDDPVVPIIHFFKFLFNRPRPWQINPNLKHYDSVSAFSPSFPSGHSAQAQYLAKKLSERYPEKKEKLYEIAEKCGLARVHGGLHFLSDHNFAKAIVKFIP